MRQLWIVVLAALVGCGGTTEESSPGSAGSAGSAGSGGGTAGTGGTGGGTAGTGGGTAGTAGTGGTTGTDAGTTIWPGDATRLHATSSGGGEVPQPPPGSDCTIGAADYTLYVATRSLTWTECRAETWEDPWLEATGSRTLTEAEYATVDAAMLGLSIYDGDMCGADKSMLVVEVTTPGGTFEYHDNFYACMGDGKVFVENIDGVFGALGELSQ